MASRFGKVDEEGINELKDLSENENTKKSTEQWKNVFVKWATERGKEKNLEACECVDPDKTLSQFYAEVRKESGEDYELDLLSYASSLRATLKVKTVPEINLILQGPLHPPSSAPGHVYNFNNCSVTLNIAGDNSAQKCSSISEVPRENHHPGF